MRILRVLLVLTCVLSLLPTTVALGDTVADIVGKWDAVSPATLAVPGDNNWEINIKNDGTFSGDATSTKSGLLEFTGTYTSQKNVFTLTGKYLYGKVRGQTFVLSLEFIEEKLVGTLTSSLNPAPRKITFFKRK